VYFVCRSFSLLQVQGCQTVSGSRLFVAEISHSCVLLLVLISVIKYLIYVMMKVIQLTAAVTYFTVVVVASMSTTDVWRGMAYC